MQRQSLGSPGSKLHIHGVLGAKEENLTEEDQKRKDQASSLPAADEDNEKSQKPHKSPPKPEKFIHLISILTILCFLVLYLSSDDPSQTGSVRQISPIVEAYRSAIGSEGVGDYEFLCLLYEKLED
ncbi:hypothetical protein Acr_28g0000390 [Actinidia rufa]|uniref:Uncharacterized protein n=1 Tax=Actinidia rufa TaxID=165716 RepID=A0A7J0H985_9ERIC|nr:hypothetical protein Acr_28g0000390 [Actinidia rufa]